MNHPEAGTGSDCGITAHMPESSPKNLNSAPPARAAFFLVGPTAVGKTSVAHFIAHDRHRSILSADSMLVYSGMDVGTAKPSREEREEVTYYGIDLVDPGGSFSVWDYHEYATGVLATVSDASPMIVAGGTGLYVKALTHGLDPSPPPNPVARQYWRSVFLSGGLSALQHALSRLDPDALESLADRQNERRLIRALETAGEDRRESSSSWCSHASGAPLVGLSMDPAVLNRRIEKRIEEMLRGGLMAEGERLLDAGTELSQTARQAIGYAEVFDCLRGRCSIEEAKARMVVRTRRLAKKQRTWFRHQANVTWVDVSETAHVAEIAEQVCAQWDAQGPTEIR